MSVSVAVRILDREYLIACTPDERAGLVDAAAYLGGKLRELPPSPFLRDIPAELLAEQAAAPARSKAKQFKLF